MKLDYNVKVEKKPEEEKTLPKNVRADMQARLNMALASKAPQAPNANAPAMPVSSSGFGRTV